MEAFTDIQTESTVLESTANQQTWETPSPYREVRYEHSRDFPQVLEYLGVSLVVSTYQAGKLFVVGSRRGELALSFHNFEQVMGIAVRPGRIAVGTLNQVWTLRSAAEIAPRLEPAGHYDGCFLARRSHFTGNIHGHEMAWGRPTGRPLSSQSRGEAELWIVNTLFSCLCTLDEEFNFVPRWRPPFVSALAPEDRCHLNGLAMADGQPRYVTALAETDVPDGWRPDKGTTGCLIHVPTGETVARGFAMPHSPRAYQGRLWLLDSGTGRLVTVDPATGCVESVAGLPGYTRGLAFHESYAFVGLSKIRERSTFGGLPIAQRRGDLRCGVAIVNLQTGQCVAHLEFQTGVEEIFAVEVLPGVRFPALSGPYPQVDGVPTIWCAPDPALSQQSLANL